MEEKTFTLTIKVQEADCPQNWEFKNASGLEQLALWVIMQKLAEKQIKKLTE